MAGPIAPLSSRAAPPAPTVIVKDGRIHIGDKVFKAKIAGKDITDEPTLKKIAKIINQHFEVQGLLSVVTPADKAHTVKIIMSTSKGMQVYHGEELKKTIQVVGKVLIGKNIGHDAEPHFKKKMSKIQSVGPQAQAGPEARVELDEQPAAPAPSLRRSTRKARGS